MKLKPENPIKVPTQQIVYGEIVQWITIFAAIVSLAAAVIIVSKPANNILSPNHIFSLIFSGEGKDIIWQETGYGFPGGHFYIRNIMTGDGIAQFGIALGCSVALWALIPSVILYIRKKDYLYAGICIFNLLLILFSLSGLISV